MKYILMIIISENSLKIKIPCQKPTNNLSPQKILNRILKYWTHS